MDSKYKSFEDLKAWRLGREFRKKIYKITKEFPTEEKYILIPQIWRAAISITSNIAEGFGRYSFQENVQFCRTAQAFAEEAFDQLYIALDEKYINEEKFISFIERGEK